LPGLFRLQPPRNLLIVCREQTGSVYRQALCLQGDARDCKSVKTGSIPVPASILSRKYMFLMDFPEGDKITTALQPALKKCGIAATEKAGKPRYPARAHRAFVTTCGPPVGLVAARSEPCPLPRCQPQPRQIGHRRPCLPLPMQMTAAICDACQRPGVSLGTVTVCGTWQRAGWCRVRLCGAVMPVAPSRPLRPSPLALSSGQGRFRAI